MPAAAYWPTRGQAIKVAVFTLLLSLLLHALTRTPFLAVYGRIGFVGAALLFAYAGAARLRPGWLGLGPARLWAVVLMAPVASFMTVLLAQGSDFFSYLSTTKALSGHIFMAILAVLFGLVFATLGLRSERRDHERAERLQVELENNRLERELLDARLRLLQAQIEPHFLFNTLANIEALVAAKSDNAGPVLRHLIDYLRAAMPRLNDADATLAHELQLVRAYLELMHLRMPDRLQFAVHDLPAMAALRFPAMALLTLVENAVRHGIDPSMHGGRIEVGGERDATSGAVTLWVSDTGVGMADTAQPGTGLANVRARLQAVYGSGARVDLHELLPHGMRVELHFELGARA